MSDQTAEKRTRRTIEVTEGAIRRLQELGGTINKGIELASYATSVDALKEARARLTIPQAAVPAKPARRIYKHEQEAIDAANDPCPRYPEPKTLFSYSDKRWHDQQVVISKRRLVLQYKVPEWRVDQLDSIQTNEWMGRIIREHWNPLTDPAVVTSMQGLRAPDEETTAAFLDLNSEAVCKAWA